MSQQQGDRIALAIVIRLGSALGLSTLNMLIKLAEARGASFAEVLFFRQGIAVPLLAMIVAAGPGLGSLRTRRIGAHVVRTASGLSGMVCLVVAVTALPLAEVTILGFTTPIFATILGALLLKEPTGWHRWIAVGVGFVGALIVARPGVGHFALVGSIAGLAWALMTAFVSIQLRQIGRTEAPLTTVFWFSTLSMPVLLPFFVASVRPHDWQCWALLVGVGLAGAFTQVSLTGALRYGPVSVVVPMDYSGLLWSTLLGAVVFGTVPALATWVGAPVVVASGLYIVWREHFRRRPETEQATALP